MDPCFVDCRFAGMAKKISTTWKSLDSEAMKVYSEMAAEDKVRYDREMTIYRRHNAELEKQKVPPAGKQEELDDTDEGNEGELDDDDELGFEAPTGPPSDDEKPGGIAI